VRGQGDCVGVGLGVGVAVTGVDVGVGVARGGVVPPEPQTWISATLFQVFTELPWPRYRTQRAPAASAKSKVSSAVVFPLLEPDQTVVHVPPPPETCRSNVLLRVLPLYSATRTCPTVRGEPRSSSSHWPSPLADQRVDRLSSTALPGTFPSFVLAITPEAPGVMSVNVPPGVGVAVGTGVGVNGGGVLVDSANTWISATLFQV
jgi:hypothetical protein